MKIIKQSLSTIAAVMIGIALAGPAQAQTVVDPATPNATPPGMNAYNDAMKTVKSDYQTAYANCKTMSGADRRNCVADAKAARKVGITNAKQTRTSAVTSESRMGGSAAMSGSPTAPSKTNP